MNTPIRHPQLLDAITEEGDEITAEHTPDPALLQRASTQPQRSGPRLESGVSRLGERRPRPVPSRAPPPLPPRRGHLQLLPLERLRALLERYTESAGPAARPIMLAEIAQLRATPERFPVALAGELLRAMARRLDDPETKNLFLSDAQRILQQEPHV